ncbi:hypothetical protein SLS53_006413 [Cytospora paraplurivora]|uniref:Uncharacterized protein n=1 Tax=Cytospora paraplurivora TaxID=2898453 RepID=A0AAN9U512_9PEZI
MAEVTPLDALEALHRELVAVCEHRFETLHILELQLDAHAQAFKKLLDKKPRSNASRDAIKTGKITVDDEEYAINADFQEITLQLADELDLDEVDSAKLLLESQDDLRTLGRPLLECGVIRFHQQRKYLLDCMRICIEIASGDDEELETLQDVFGSYVTENIYNGGIVSRCVASMQEVKNWLQKLADRVTTASVVYAGAAPRVPIHELVEFSRISLIQQHELLALIMASAIDKRHAKATDFQNLLKFLQKVDRYDQLLVHLFPVIGTYITVFGSTEGNGDLHQAREFHSTICKQADDNPWVLPYLQAAVRAWWIIEYSGWFIEPTDASTSREDELERVKRFTEALKDGAFDFTLAVAADVKTPEWQDPARLFIRQWLQRKSPSLLDAAQFSEQFQVSLMIQLEMLVEGLISNMPDVLRKMRSEEDEQRQLSQTHEQDLDLERFLLIIAYAYEGRPDAAEAFWTDPDSNLAGFLHWASRRASTPLVSAFCEMLQSISDDDACATAAHEFLLDEGQQSTGKMRKTLSLTWDQIFKELNYFTGKLRDPRPSTSQSHHYRNGKPTAAQAEDEPESAMMLECYLRLITKLTSQSEDCRTYLLKNDFNLAQALFFLASSLPLSQSRLKSCAFYALRALMSRKTQEECAIMWAMLDVWATGQHNAPQPLARQTVASLNQTPVAQMRRQLMDASRGFEEPNALVQLLNSLVSPVVDSSPLNDVLPFPEELGSHFRLPGIDPYVDYVLGFVLAENSGLLQDVTQMTMLRLSCLEFALLCLDTFNEDLIVLGNETSIPIDSLVGTTDLAAYVRLHPFARVMEWMLNDRVMAALFESISRRDPDDVAQVASATPDSPIILSILRAVEVVTKVLDMQDTYADLVRPLLKSQSLRKEPVATAYISFEDGFMNHLPLVVSLGRYCGMGHPALTLACLKLLEKVSSSSKIASSWNPGQFGQTHHRNKAIVAMETKGDPDSISGSFIAELTSPIDLARGSDAPDYMIKVYILDFLFACLSATPDRPTIAHLLLGFQCGIDTISVETDGDFDSRTSLFHNLLRVLLETPFGDDETGMWRWTIELKFKIMRILRILWTSSLSSSIVLTELRDNDFLFHLLLREITIQPLLPWDGQILSGPDFLLTEGSMTFISFLALRAITFEYASIELCSVSQHRLPHFKRRLLDALNGQLKGDDGGVMPVSSIFELFDFLPTDGQQWDVPPPSFQYYRDLDLRPCLTEDADGNPISNIGRVKEILLLKRNEFASLGQVATDKDIEAMDREEALLLDFLEFSNRQKQLASFRLKVLRSWSQVLLVMLEANEFKGSAQASFLLQALQVILPSLENYASQSPDEAYELAKLAKVLLFKIDFSTAASEEGSNQKVGDLVGEKLLQLFQICLSAIGKLTGNSELRALYYIICYRYLSGIVQKSPDFLPSRHKAFKSINVHGERLLSVVCDDAYGSDAGCQTAALILLSALVKVGTVEKDAYVVEGLNNLNFVGILIDSLKSVLQEWLEIVHTRNAELELLWNAKLALILSISQTRAGAKCVLQANLLHAVELSGLFSADPELEIDPSDTTALEKHYALLVLVARIIAAAVLTRGPQSNVTQGPARRFLIEHRMLVVHVLKRNAGIGGRFASQELEESVEELAEALMVLITATGFLEFEEEMALPNDGASRIGDAPVLFH